MFLFGDADESWATINNSKEDVEKAKLIILHHRQNFDKGVEVLCKLCEQAFGSSSYTPNLHSLHHMIRRLVVVKGHSTFEMIGERLVSKLSFKIYVFMYSLFTYIWLLLLLPLLILLVLPLLLLMSLMALLMRCMLLLWCC